MAILTVTVAVLTFKRPAQLAAALPPILQQVEDLVHDPSGRWDASVLVIDNDPAETARLVVEGTPSARLRYVAEPTPGIAAARNRAVSETGDAHVIAFIDDDERPLPEWLRSLLTTWERERCAAVAGRVVPVYPDGVSRWIVDGRFFVRRTLPTGTRVQAAPTSNLLLDRGVLDRTGLRFDERLGLRGGEDTLMTRQLVQRGEAIVWCDESIVEDIVPAERATARWVLRRAWSHGNTSALVEMAIAQTTRRRWAVRASSAVGGLARIAVGAARAAAGTLLRSNGHSARGLRAAYRGGGMVAAAFGVAYQEYARPSGTTSTIVKATGPSRV